MINEVLWSKQSEEDLSKIIDYLIHKWNNKIASTFLSDIESSISTISSQPKLYPVIYKKANVRRCVITKHNTLFYTQKRNKIYILRIFDTRQDPKKLKFTI